MKPFYIQRTFLFLLLISFSFFASAQYCSPTINSSGIYLLQINFTTYGDVLNGQTYYTGSNGYTQTLASAGTIKRYFGGSFFYSISNPGMSTKPYNFRVYADWNNDGDFDDANELCANVSGSITGNTSSTTGNSVVPPLNTLPGNYRIRMAVSESGTANNCGSYTGEVEDYILTIQTNTAPVLNTSSPVVLNTLLSSETNSNGISLNEFIESSMPANTLINDGDDRSANSFYDLVPRGIAVYDQTATNGTWQYKIGNGTWTDFGGISATNSLLLLADAGNAAYQPGTRIRFVPTAAGTPTFNFRAWDGTKNLNGTYANSTSTGGSNPFSTGNLSASLPVISSAAYTSKIYFSTYDNTIYAAPFNRNAKAIANAELLLTNADDYYAPDIALDVSGNKLFWISGSNTDKIASSNMDGTSEQLSLINSLTYSTGMAAANSKLYYWSWASDYSTADLYQSNEDGSGIIQISGGAGQFDGTGISDTKDIEIYNNKIYFQYSDGTNYIIASANTNGSGYTSLYSTPNYFGGLAVASDTLYWTESDGTLNKMSTSGGAVTQLVSESGRIFNDLMVDPLTSSIYFVEADAVNSTYSLIRKVSTLGGTVSTILTISGTVASISFDNTFGTLPVSVLNFTGQYDAVNKQSLLKWSTASENNSAYFILQRSIDANNFIKVDSATTAGNSTTLRNYNYNDDVSKIAANKFYYRLKQVDADGHFKYSPIVVLTRNDAVSIAKVTPNPGNGIYNVQLSTLPLNAVSINVYNTGGILVSHDKFNTQQYNLDISKQANGIYHVEIIYADKTKKLLTLIKE